MRPSRQWTVGLALSLLLGACADDAAPRDVDATEAVTDTARETAAPETVVDTLVDETEPDHEVDVETNETPDVVETVEATLDTIAPDVGPPACDPPLSVEPAEAWTFAFGNVALTASGGTGNYRFALAEDRTKPLLNVLTGAYLAGATVGDDRVVVSDLGCVGEVEGVVHVVAPMEVVPRSVKLTPATTFTPQVEGGSGAVVAALADPDSGATLVGMAYTAGDEDGIDDLVITDTQTGQRETIRVIIETGTTLVARPALVHVPVGHRFRYAALGGSGFQRGEGARSGLVAEADGWHVEAPGTYAVELVDRFTGQRAAQTVVGVAALPLPVLRSGTQTFHYAALGPGDLDGDGYRDAVVGIGDANVTRYQSGGVYVYAGTSEGLAPEPVQVLSGSGREDNAGRSLVVADLDGDALPDLAYGIFRADPSGVVDGGAVAIHRGVARADTGLFFEPEPSRVIGGPFGADNLGYALAVCDFDGDGHLDLAAGAWTGEDRTLSPLLSNQGVVHVFRGVAGALPGATADYLVGGVGPSDASWVPVANARAGAALAAGDFDGDGLCDLANANYQWTNVAANDGMVQVFRGELGAGLTRDPSFAVVSSSAGGARIGMWLAAGDVDGDGDDDLAIAGGYWNKTSSDRTGRARLFLGGERFAGPAVGFAPVDGADLVLEGAASNDYLGYQVAIGDVTGDALADLVVSGWLSECAGCPTNGGRIDVHAGQLDALPAAIPTWHAGGAAAEDRQGSALAVIGPGLVIGVAGMDDTLGPDVARPWAITPDAATPLGLPGEPGGWRVGLATALLPDLDGDGFDELAVGAPNEAARRANGTHHVLGGAVHVYRGSEDGFGAAPAYTLQDFTGHSGSDWLGFGLGAGDFDGDGAADLVMLARFDDAPSSFAAATYTTLGTCPSGSRNNAGAVLVHLGDAAAGRVGAQPAFVRFGAAADQSFERVVVLDLDGDGRDDVVAASVIIDAPGRGDAGGFEVMLGRARGDTKINVLCDADLRWTGVSASDNAGSALAALGDVDGDGCEDFALGAWLEDGGATNQGAVRVVLGWGASCASATARAITLVPGVAEDRAGQSLGAADIDGDGRRELIVGGATHRVNAIPVGAAWVVDGRRLAALPALPLTEVAPATRHPLVEDAALRVEGLVRDEAFGLAVAAAPGLIAVASQASDVTGPAAISAVRVYRVLSDGDGLVAIEPEPVAVLGGESGHTRAMREASLLFFQRGGVPWLAIGASEARALALDSGAVYVAPLEGAP